MSETIFARIEASLKRRGNRTALVAESKAVTGNELLQRVVDLAAGLCARGVRPGDTVGVMVDRSADTVATILAILQMNCVYLPLDPATPKAWLSGLVDLAGACMPLCTDSSDADAVSNAMAPLLRAGVLAVHGHDREDRRYTAHDNHQDETRLAYVMGTSGTTGKPKAVPIRESSLLHYCDSFASRIGGPQMLVDLPMASVSTLAADLGNTMVFPALLFGGELHLVPQSVSRDPDEFADYVQRHEIGAIKIVPTHLRMLLERGTSVLPRKLLIVGGEAFTLDLLKRLEKCKPGCAVFNHYGPTEATVGVAMFGVSTAAGTAESLELLGHDSVPIGSPLGDNELQILDNNFNLCPAGDIGELFVTGPSVSHGYLGGDSLSQEKFVVTSGGAYPTYRTGDRARFGSTGQLELLGRMDRQLKIRGYRVEPGGIEEEIRSHPGVVDAFVGTKGQGDGGSELIAWIHANQWFEETALRTFLDARLPKPMIPSHFIIVDLLPRTPNGKIDHASLPQPNPLPAVAAVGSIQEAVARVFANVLTVSVQRAQGNFFRLGGHSISALQAISRLREDYGLLVTVKDFYANPTPAGIASMARPVKTEQLAAQSDPGTQEPSPQVHALWTHLQLNPSDHAYEIPLRLRILGPVTEQDIRLGLRRFVQRHEALRTRFAARSGKPFPILEDNVESVLSEVDHERDLHANSVLDIERGPLMRATITHVGPNESLLSLVVHHVAFDGSSTAVFVRELACQLGGQSLPPPQRVGARSRVNLDEKPTPLGDGVRSCFGMPPAKYRIVGASGLQAVRLSELLWQQVELCATALNTTPFVLTATAWAFVLSRQDGEPTITIGTPVDLRDQGRERFAVGYHTNVVVLEINIPPDKMIRDVIDLTHHALGRALQGRHYPYANLVADQRATTELPPTRTMLTIERMENASCGNVMVQQEAVLRSRPTFDLDVCVVLENQQATLQIHYRSALCTDERACCLADQLIYVLEQMVSNPTRKPSDLSILPVEWENRIAAWSRGSVAALPEEWGSGAFSRQFEADPNATAAVWPGGKWSRAQFLEAVVRFSGALGERGLGPGHAVAVAIQPSPALAVAWHAVHRIGAAVLALDPVWPEPRQNAAAREAHANCWVSSPDGVALNVTGHASVKAVYDSDLAYLILTSGSTGAPKLVGIQHSALANELSWSMSSFAIGSNDRVLAHSAPGFDVTVWESLGPLSRGACLVFPGVNRRNDAAHLADLIHSEGVTVMQAVPSLIDALLDKLDPVQVQLRLLVSGGEEMPPSLATAMAERLHKTVLLNTYGPSETAIDVTFYQVDPEHIPADRIPLGRPIAGTSTYVLDEGLRRLPPGAWGQLAISGNCVGRGYVNDSVATAQRFVADPFPGQQNARMYLTGDRARWNDDGLLEFGGRIDHQVKVRGNRVEPEEVESALRNMPMVRDAMVQLRDSGTLRAHLVALIVPTEAGELTVGELHKRCAQLLPSYMTPNAFVLVESLPRLSNGKLARNALPLSPIPEMPTAGIEYQTEMEVQVGRVWMKVLDRTGLNRDLPFFASGGTSLLIPVLQLQLQQAFDVVLLVAELFEHVTIADQAKCIEQRLAGMEPQKAALAGRGKLRRLAYSAVRRRPAQ
jgi:amino acid adenylation domain-containing protein